MESSRSKRASAACETQEHCSKCACLLGHGWCESCIASVDPEKQARLAKEQRKRAVAGAARKSQQDAEDAQLVQTREAMRLGWVPNFAEGNSDNSVTAQQFLASYVPPAAAAAVVADDVLPEQPGEAPDEVPHVVVSEAKKRGRPKGSKNKAQAPPEAEQRVVGPGRGGGAARRRAPAVPRAPELNGDGERYDAAAEPDVADPNEKEQKGLPWMLCDMHDASVDRNAWLPSEVEFRPASTTGPRAAVFAGCTSEMAFVKHFLNRALFQTIVDGTNAAGARLFTSERHPWSDLTLSEFWSYVAVVYEMGLSDLPTISDYWSHGRRRNQLIVDLLPSCHRFCQISRALRCMDFPFHADQENWRRAQREHGPFAKTANFVTSLSQVFEDAYDLEVAAASVS